MLDLEKNLSLTWDGSKKLGRVGHRPKKEFPDEKALRGRFALGLRKKSKATVYRSENIGAGKQSAGRRVGKNFPSPMESFPWQGCVFFGGVFFPGEKIKVPDEKIFHGISVAGLRKNFGRDSASEWRHGAARKNLAGSAIGGGRRPTREILGLKKKSSLQGLAGEVLTICKRGCFASEDWRGVNVAEHGFGTSRFAVIVVTGARRAPAPSERLRR